MSGLERFGCPHDGKVSGDRGPVRGDPTGSAMLALNTMFVEPLLFGGAGLGAMNP